MSSKKTPGKQNENRADLVKPGLTVKVYEKIKDVDAKGEDRERTQIFEGIILAVKKPRTISGTITVRKISEGVGVEKIFPIHSPLVEKIVPVKQAQVRQAKLYYLRRSKKRIKEDKV
jgi:large subunit ribosomal protein L19